MQDTDTGINTALAKADKRFMPHGPATIVLAAVIAMVVIAAGLFIYVRENAKYKASTGKTAAVCTADTIKAATPYLSAGKRTQLKPIADKVKSTKNYDHDPNCLLITLTYAIYTSDAKNSQEEMAKLKKVYDPKDGFSTDFGPSRPSMESLQRAVDNAVAKQAEFEKNIDLVSGPQQ